METETLEREDELAGTASFMAMLGIYAFGTKDICELGGIRPKALDNLFTLRYVSSDRPPGRGGRREFTGRQVIEIVLLFRFLGLGVRLSKSSRLFQTITTNYLERWREAYSRDPRLARIEMISDILVVTPNEDNEENSFYLTKAQYLDVGRISDRGAIILPIGRMIAEIAWKWFARQRAPVGGSES